MFVFHSLNFFCLYYYFLILDIFSYARAHVRTGSYAPVSSGRSVVDRHLKVAVLPNRNG